MRKYYTQSSLQVESNPHHTQNTRIVPLPSCSMPANADAALQMMVGLRLPGSSQVRLLRAVEVLAR